MKVTVERIPEGVRVSVTADTSRKPITFVIQPGQLGLLTQILGTAMAAEKFRFEMQL